MSRSRWKLTPALEQAIVAYIRAGSYPRIAAEAAGVPEDVFADWLKRGDAPGATQPYRAFADAVRQAHAQARVAAEITILGKRPLDWLKSGPGKPTGGQPGWTGPAKAADGRARQTHLLLELQGVLAELIGALEPYPAAREAVSEKVANALAQSSEKLYYCS